MVKLQKRIRAMCKKCTGLDQNEDLGWEWVIMWEWSDSPGNPHEQQEFTHRFLDFWRARTHFYKQLWKLPHFVPLTLSWQSEGFGLDLCLSKITLFRPVKLNNPLWNESGLFFFPTILKISSDSSADWSTLLFH